MSWTLCLLPTLARRSATAASRWWRWWSSWSSTVHLGCTGNRRRSFTSCPACSCSCSSFPSPATGERTTAGRNWTLILVLTPMSPLSAPPSKLADNSWCDYFSLPAGVTRCVMPLTSWASSQLSPKPSCCCPRRWLCLMREDRLFPLSVGHIAAENTQLTNVAVRCYCAWLQFEEHVWMKTFNLM